MKYRNYKNDLNKIILISSILSTLSELNSISVSLPYSLEEKGWTCYGKITKVKNWIKKNIFLLVTILSILIGVGLGFLIREFAVLTKLEKSYFEFPGEIFLRNIKFLILPLIVSSLISSIGNIKKNGIGKIAIKALVYYMFTTFTSIIIGLTLANTIKPGSRVNYNSSTSSLDFQVSDNKTKQDETITIVLTIFDLIRNMFPDNLVQMTFLVYQSKLKPNYKIVNQTIMNMTSNMTEIVETEVFDYWEAKPSSRNGLNVVGLALFSAAFGLVFSNLGTKGNLVLEIFDGINEASINIFKKVMWYSPIGNCFLVCYSIISVDNISGLFQSIPFYILTMIVSLIAQGLICVTAYLILTRKNVFRFIRNIAEALVLAIATSSSAATLPLTLKCMENKNKVNTIVTRFMLTVGTSINVDGTTMYTLIAALFIAQLNNINVTVVDNIVIGIIAAFASIGSAGIPAGATLALLAILGTLDIPVAQISIFLTLDWIMDRLYTFHNVLGSCLGTGIVEHISLTELTKKGLDLNQDEPSLVSPDNKSIKSLSIDPDNVSITHI